MQPRVRRRDVVASTAVDLGPEPLVTLDWFRNEPGQITKLHSDGRIHYLVKAPTLVYQVLSRTNSFVKPITEESRTDTFLGEGLLTAAGESWLNLRRSLGSAFSSANIDAYTSIAEAVVRRFIEGWRDGGTYDMQAEMRQLAAEVAAACFLGISDHPESNKLAVSLELAIRSRGQILRGGRAGSMCEPMQFLGRTVDNLLQAAHASKSMSPASTLLLASDVRAARDANWLRDQLVTLLFASYDAPAMLFAWALYNLSLRPGLWPALRAEAERDDRSGIDRTVSLVDSVVLETMRLCPPVWVMPRVATRDLRLGQYKVPLGSVVVVSQWVNHRDAIAFPDPLTFRPERWFGGLESHLPRGTFFPFGIGQRLCIGRSMAMLAAGRILRTIAEAVDLELSGPAPGFASEIVLRSIRGIRLKVNRLDVLRDRSTC